MNASTSSTKETDSSYFSKGKALQMENYSGVETFIVDSISLQKSLKLFKLDDLLYLKITKNKIYMKNIDFVQCLGIIESELVIKECTLKDKEHLSISLPIQTLLTKLESYTKDLKVQIDYRNSILKLVNIDQDQKSKTFFSISFSKGSKVESIICAQWLSSEDWSSISYVFDSNKLLESFKKLAIVQNNLILDIEYTPKTVALSKEDNRIEDLSFVLYVQKNEEIGKHNLHFSEIEKVYCTKASYSKILEFYYASALFHNIIKQFKKIKLDLYDRYIVITPISSETTEKAFSYTLYIPYRELKDIAQLKKKAH